MTLEQMRSVPRSLRGAGKRRRRCGYCGLVHVAPPAYCEKNPNREETLRRTIEAAKEGSRRKRQDPEHNRRRNEGIARWWSLPGSREAHAERMRKAGERARRKGTQAGPNNGHYGHRHSLKTRLAQSARMTEQHRRRAAESVRKEEVIPMSDPRSFPRPIGFDRMDDHGWVPVESHGWSGNDWSENDDFDPFA